MYDDELSAVDTKVLLVKYEASLEELDKRFATLQDDANILWGVARLLGEFASDVRGILVKAKEANLETKAANLEKTMTSMIAARRSISRTVYTVREPLRMICPTVYDKLTQEDE